MYMETFINSFSWKCLLGKQAKNISESSEIYTWDVGKKKHFATNKILNINEVDFLVGRSFHYLTEENLNIIKSKYKVNKTKNISVVLDLTKFTIAGNINKKIRHSINLAKKSNLIIQDNFDNIDDVKEMLNEWSDVLAQKYFRDFSGKNEYFYSKNYHKDCINIFVYQIIDDKKKLVSFATASPNKEDCSYIIGKALCNKIHGLSEYTDYLLYNKLIELGFEKINLGQATKGLLKYKTKFPGAKEIIHFDGNF